MVGSEPAIKVFRYFKIPSLVYGGRDIAINQSGVVDVALHRDMDVGRNRHVIDFNGRIFQRAIVMQAKFLCAAIAQDVEMTYFRIGNIIMRSALNV